MTARELREQVGFLVSQCSDKTVFTAAQLNAYAFEAMQHAALQVRMPTLRTVTTMDFTSTQRYLPVDVLKLLSMEALIGGEWQPLPRISREKAVEYSALETGNYWYPDGVETTAGADRGKGKFTLFPTPTTTVTDGLRASYLRKPTKLSTLADTDEIIDFPEFFHLAIAYEAAWLYLSRQGSKGYKDFSGYHQFYTSRIQSLEMHAKEDTAYDTHGYQISAEWGGPAETAWRIN